MFFAITKQEMAVRKLAVIVRRLIEHNCHISAHTPSYAVSDGTVSEQRS